MHCHFSHKQSKHETNREKERERERQAHGNNVNKQTKPIIKEFN